MVNEIGRVAAYDEDKPEIGADPFYVAFLAAKEVDQDPDKYFPGLAPDAPTDYAAVRLPSHVSVDGLVKAAGVTTVLYLPWFLGAWVYYGSPVPHTVIAKGATILPQGGAAVVAFLAPPAGFFHCLAEYFGNVVIVLAHR